MSGLGNVSINKLVATRTLDSIINCILLCIKKMQTDCLGGNKMIPNNELNIRDYLFFNYLNDDDVMKEIGFTDIWFFAEAPVNYIDNIPKGRADLQIFSFNYFKSRQEYFIVECKRIDGTKTLNRKYIDEGIRRFVGDSPLYTSFCNTNGLLGFVVKNIDITVNANIINELLRTDYLDINTYSYLHKDTGKRVFSSSHKLRTAEKVELKHAFFDISSIVSTH